MKEKTAIWANRKTRHVINALVFIVVLVILIRSLTWLFRANDIESREDIIGFENTEENIDVVMIGSSNLLRYYIPLQAYSDYGFTSYNYATSSAEMNLLKYYIEEVEKYQSPKLYVINIGCILYMDKMSEAGLRNWADSLDILNMTRFKGITTYISDYEKKNEIDVLSCYFDLAKYHNSDAVLENIQRYDMYTEEFRNVDKGFKPYLNVHPFSTPKQYSEFGELTEVEYNTVVDLLDYCDQNAINVLFMVTPFYLSEDNCHTIQSVGRIIDERGYEFVDFNNYYEEMGIDFATDYADSGHVNYNGAVKFTAFLANYIVDNYELPDHRDDTAYNNWAKDVEGFATKQTEWKRETDLNTVSVVSGRDRGEKIREIDDFDEWLGTVSDKNYSLIIAKNRSFDWSTDSFAFSKFVKETGMSLDEKYYVGIFSGESVAAENSNDNSVTYEGCIGITGGDQSSCLITSGEKGAYIVIDGIDYASKIEGIQIVVFDNNFMRIYDVVNLKMDKSGNVYLERINSELPVERSSQS